ncbi:hypothetical protein CcCBS67573_g08934 [Chytriomyces confervae]|uniref:Homeobox domain-containing protein n=1 Tax=Chytriomyces confervae TaxID=246404 RepID=A0A507EBY5_9FUNG|nr:hypothetical protein CcCBS67573_g08934 [Chytriomyces confervae]
MTALGFEQYAMPDIDTTDLFYPSLYSDGSLDFAQVEELRRMSLPPVSMEQLMETYSTYLTTPPGFDAYSDYLQAGGSEALGAAVPMHFFTIPSSCSTPTGSQSPEPTPTPGELISPPTSPEKKLQTFIDPNHMKKNNRFKVKDNDLKCLLAVFEKNPFPSVGLRRKLSERLNMEQKQVQFWFQNRRATLKMNGIHVLKPKVNGGSSNSSLVPGLK